MTRLQLTQKQKRIVILILGSMTALSPFSIDMYLPAFPTMATDLGTTVSRISLSLSSYFAGISFGQLFYGPLLDRFGRKRPLYCGLLLYILASLACMTSTSAEHLILWRLVQALGACVAGVASMAMVRDLFETHESAKVFSLLVLILGVSPLLAPTFGGFLAAKFGWKAVFLTLAFMAACLLATVKLFLVDSHKPDASVSLRPDKIFKSYFAILKNPAFSAYAFATAIAFSGLFVYLAGSPVIFMENYKVSGAAYGTIFAFIAAGIISASQVNVVALKKFSDEQLLFAGLASQVTITAIFVIGEYFDILGLYGTVFLFFLFLCCFGFTNPNATALALRSYPHAAGRAAALLGFLQMTLGALFSTTVALFDLKTPLPVVAILLCTSTGGLTTLLIGRAVLSRHRRREATV